MRKIEEIRKKCEKHNISLAKVFREANVPQSTIQNWERKEPEAFVKLDKINETIEKLIEEKTE